jgi:predicted GNAT superfamily acetyltransferase
MPGTPEQSSQGGAGLPGVSIRNLELSDHRFIISVVNDWWGGRNMTGLLPRLFFEHFRPTSFVAECDRAVVGFLIGFISQTTPSEAYIRFAGVRPDCRGQGLGRALYQRFFAVVRGSGCSAVRCVTSPVNKTSIAFHVRLGFAIEPGSKTVDGVPVTPDYDAQGGDRVLFFRALAD